MSLLKQNITKIGWVKKNIHLELKLKIDNDKKYQIKVIQDSTVYINKTKDQLLKLNYLISWKGYLKVKNT